MVLKIYFHIKTQKILINKSIRVIHSNRQSKMIKLNKNKMNNKSIKNNIFKSPLKCH